MNRKIVIISLLIMSMLLTSLGCSNTQTGKEQEFIDITESEKIYSDIEKQLLEDASIDSEIKEIIEASADIDMPESTYSKIQKDFINGKISRKEECLLLLQAAYTPEGLPEKYKGVKYKGGLVSLDSEIQWFINHQQELDEETKEIVRPFIIPAKDPDSYFYPTLEDNKGVLDKLSRMNTVDAAPTNWSKKKVTFSTAPADITIYYRQNNLSKIEKEKIKDKVLAIEDALKESWLEFKDLLGVQPEHEMEIYLTNKLAKDINGEEFCYIDNNDNADGYEIRLKESLPGCKLKSTTAHELFHSFQDRMGLHWHDKSSDLDWLKEATAVWSENFIYPSCNMEREYVKDFFGTLNSDRLSTIDTQEYSSYIMFYFLDKFTENSVDDFLHAAVYEKGSMDIRGMMMREIGPENLKDTYGKFAVYNWNKAPFQKYKDTPPFPSIIPWGNSREVYVKKTHETKEYTAGMERGGITYHIFAFTTPPEKVGMVKFDFENEIPKIDGKDYVKRQALIKANDSWKLEDWTQLDEREFCRRNDSENIDFVVLIHSNSCLIDSVNYDYTVETGECPMKGYTNINYKLVASAEGISKNESFDLYSDEEIEYCPLSNSLVLTKREAEINYQHTSTMPNPFGNGDNITQNDMGTGSISEEYTDEDTLTKLTINEDGTVTLNLFPETNTNDWIQYTKSGYKNEESTSSHPPLARGYIDIEDGVNSYTSHTGEEITQECIIDENTISGVVKIKKAEALGTGEYTIEFKYNIWDLGN